ncbi:MAG: hypothetical protein CXT73_03715 [Methanobacteriota archaeon]|nr:MAG: hypothetical protein CXT73_03715 [Euryarchaeota archaeon]
MTPDNYSQNIVNLHKKNQINVDIKKTVVGFILFFIIFVILIPVILFKSQMYGILEAYMPNVDLIATVISWHGGPLKLWDHLYPPSPVTIYGFYSQTIINYMSLLGLTYIITRETQRTGSMARGWSMAFIMLLMTYLLPGQFISWIMDKTNGLISNYFKFNFISSNSIVVIMGFFLVTIIIASEAHILHNFKKKIFLSC